ncbi:MAG: hypothetical protein IT371_25400 [Deltaproteobacteria bacterium]|nr:hypothetical protein [Deltaproteobacteria bacterium]
MLAGTAVVIVFLFGMSLRNRSRYRVVCSDGRLELQRGRGMPLPFGFEAGTGAFSGLKVPAGVDCPEQHFGVEEEAEAAVVEFLVAQARRALSSPGTPNFAAVRDQLHQALRLTRLEAHRTRRTEVQELQAELVYREGRAGLARAETELRASLGRLQEAQRLNPRRYEDLGDWIAHVESLLRAISPTPGPPATGLGTPAPGAPPRGASPTVAPHAPGTSPPTTGARPPSAPPADAGAPASADGAPAPTGGGGILM